MYYEFLKKTFLLKDLTGDDESLARKLITAKMRKFEKGELVFNAETADSYIGFVKDGMLEVRRTGPNGEFIPLNTVGKYGSFGVLSLFSAAEYPTEIYAKKSTEVIFVEKEYVLDLIKLFPAVSLSIINFLTDRIAFLNDKIAAFSGGTVTEKLAAYLLSLYKRNSSLEFKFNKKLASEALNLGRASVYRALDALLESNIIDLDDKKIIIKDLKGLERMSK